MQNTAHIDAELLLAYAERRTTAEEASATAAHLGRCDSCADHYVFLVLKSNVRTVVAPDEIWIGIQRSLQARGPSGSRGYARRGHRNYWLGAVSVFALGIFVASIALWRSHQRAEAKTLDLGGYLATLERTSSRPNAANLRDDFPGFAPDDQDTHLVQTRLRPQVDNFRLVERQVSRIRTASIVQLLYDSGTDSFVVFVAPRTAILNFGMYHLLSVDLDGLLCRRAECPRQDVYLVTANTQQYVFIRRHTSSVQSDRLFKELMQGVL